MRLKGYRRECGERVSFSWAPRVGVVTVRVNGEKVREQLLDKRTYDAAEKFRAAYEANDREEYRLMVEENLRVESGAHKWEPSADGINCAVCDYPVTASTHSENA